MSFLKKYIYITSKYLRIEQNFITDRTTESYRYRQITNSDRD